MGRKDGDLCFRTRWIFPIFSSFFCNFPWKAGMFCDKMLSMVLNVFSTHRENIS